MGNPRVATFTIVRGEPRYEKLRNSIEESVNAQSEASSASAEQDSLDTGGADSMRPRTRKSINILGLQRSGAKTAESLCGGLCREVNTLN